MTHIWFIVNVEAAIWRDGRYLIGVRGAGESHAAGALSLIGGKVEEAEPLDDVLERTAKREIAEEVGLTDTHDFHYVESKYFQADDGDPCVDIVLLCRSNEGEPINLQPDEVAELHWMTPDEILTNPAIPLWTLQSIQRAEVVRQALGW